jgi:processive 1,2-diacylglycerol beta-glucosyltransferase
MVELRDKESGNVVGSITEAQLQFLINQLEEESDSDTDYYVNGPTLEMLADRGIDEPLLTLLRNALGDREGMEIQWERQ